LKTYKTKVVFSDDDKILNSHNYRYSQKGYRCENDDEITVDELKQRSLDIW